MDVWENWRNEDRETVRMHFKKWRQWEWMTWILPEKGKFQKCEACSRQHYFQPEGVRGDKVTWKAKRIKKEFSCLWPWGLDYASTSGHIPFQVQWLAWRKIWKTTGKGPRVSSLVWFGSLGHIRDMLWAWKNIWTFHFHWWNQWAEPVSWTWSLKSWGGLDAEGWMHTSGNLRLNAV